MDALKQIVTYSLMFCGPVAIGNDNNDIHITDLSATSDADNCIVLRWSRPEIYSEESELRIENFEAYRFGDYSTQIGDWRNIDRDEDYTFGFEGYSEIVPDESMPKAFQIISALEMKSRGEMDAHSGDKFICAMGGFFKCSDDWFVSPRLKSESELKFWVRAMSDKYVPEKLEILYSESDSNIDEFKLISTENISTATWQELSYQLPPGADCFALHYCSDNVYGIGIDDVSYTPVGNVLDINGYNVYRRSDGNKAFNVIAENIKECKYTDIEAEIGIEYEYYVTAISDNGECGRSATIKAERQDISDVFDISVGQFELKLSDGGITLLNVKSPIEIRSTSGILCAEICNDGFYLLPVGIYIVRSWNSVMKICIK